MEGDYARRLIDHGLQPVIRGPWAVVGNSSREQGWKLHVSSIPSHADQVIDRIAPLLRDLGVAFKLARNGKTLGSLNEGLLGPTQIGKFATVYPSDDEEARRLVLMLRPLLRDLDGPVVVTDLALGDNVFARYGGIQPQVLRNRLGQSIPAIRDEDGSLHPDAYSVPFQLPEGATNPFSDLLPEPQGAASIGGTMGAGYLLLDTLAANAKGCVFLAADLRCQETPRLAVLKEGRKHCLSDEFGRDIRTRLHHQFNLHQRLQDHLPIPRARECFEQFGNAYLVLDYVEGAAFAPDIGPYGALRRDRRVILASRLLNLVQAVGRMHALGYVHRDLKPSNILVARDGSVCLLDLELAHRLGDDAPPFSQGTPGYASPQQIDGMEPSVTDDIFSLGSLITFAFSAIDPQTILFRRGENRQSQIAELTQLPYGAAKVLGAALSEAASERPSLDDIQSVLESLENWEGAQGRPRRRAVLEPETTLSSSALGILSDTPRSETNGMWLSPVLRDSQSAALGAYALYRSANRGVAGPLYLLARLEKCGVSIPGSHDRLVRAVDWLLSHADTPDDQLPGLHFGEAGVAVAIAEAVSSGVLTGGEWLYEYLEEALTGPLDWPDITHGAAGQGLAAMICGKLLQSASVERLAHRCTGFLLEHQDRDGGWTIPAGVPGMSGDRLTGFAHGVAGIVYYLASYEAVFGQGAAGDAWRRGAAWLIDRGEEHGHGIAWPVKDGSAEKWNWWCHGAPGIALAFLRAAEVSGADNYGSIAGRALASLPQEFRNHNLSQCHGMSGLGEIYLEAYRLLGTREWLERAQKIGDLLFNLGRVGESGGMTWLVEDRFQTSADLMIGSAGVAHFLARLTNPQLNLSPPLLFSLKGYS